MQNPSLAEVMKAGELPEMALGRADAPVTIIQYASMTCPYCRKFQLETFPVLKKEYIDTGKVRFILREFPIGKQSGLATIALRCAAPDKYFTLYEKLMAQQASWVSQEVRPDPIFKVAAQVGMTRAQFDSLPRESRHDCRGSTGIKERGRTLGVIGTPNFFIHGKLVKSVIGIDEIREMVDPILAGRVADRRHRRLVEPLRRVRLGLGLRVRIRVRAACVGSVPRTPTRRVPCTSTGFGSSASSPSSSRPSC